jgi:Ser/Thr protein kinase RdoA (MazF antagonist)
LGRSPPISSSAQWRPAGLRCDGRLLTLNSYENRVYQVGIEDAAPLIAKFYRPGRWSDAAILEEHAFLAELEDAEIPAVAALEIGGHTLHHHEGFRIALFPRRGGRAPELDDPEVLGWLGRFLGRIHAVGAIRAFTHRPTLDIRSFGETPRDTLLASAFLPPELRDTWRSVVDQALDGVRRCFERAGSVPQIRLHGDVHGGNVLWTDAGPHFVDFDDARNGPAIQDLWMLLSGDAQAMARQLDSVLEGYEQFADFDPQQPPSGGGPAHPAPDPLRRLDRHPLGRPGLPRRPWQLVRHPALLAGHDPVPAGTGGADG